MSWDYIWSRDQRIMWLCAWWPNTISHHLVEFGIHEPYKNRYRTFFNRHLTIASCDHCGWWPLLINHHHCCLFKFPGHLYSKTPPNECFCSKEGNKKIFVRPSCKIRKGKLCGGVRFLITAGIFSRHAAILERSFQKGGFTVNTLEFSACLQKALT